MKNSLLFLLLWVSVFSNTSCNCLSADCPSEGASISMSFKMGGSSETISLDDKNISVTTKGGSNVDFIPGFIGLDLEQKSIAFFAYSSESYIIRLDNTTSVSFAIETIVEFEDDCCKQFAIDKIRVDEQDLTCDELCKQLGAVTVRI